MEATRRKSKAMDETIKVLKQQLHNKQDAAARMESQLTKIIEYEMAEINRIILEDSQDDTELDGTGKSSLTSQEFWTEPLVKDRGVEIELRELLDRSVLEASVLRQRVGEMQCQFDEKQDRVEKAEKRVVILRKQVSNLHESKSFVANELDSLSKSYQQQQNENARLRKEMKRSAFEESKLLQRLQEMECQLNKKQTRMKKEENRAVVAEKSILVLKMQVSSLQEAKITLAEELDSIVNAHMRRMEDNYKLEKQWTTAKQMAAQREKTLERDIAALQCELDEKEARAKKEENRAVASEKAVGSLKVRVSGLEEGMNRLMCELDSLSNQGQLNEKQTRMKKEENRAVVAEKSILVLKMQVSSLQEAKITLEEDLDSISNAHMERIEENYKLEKQLATAKQIAAQCEKTLERDIAALQCELDEKQAIAKTEENRAVAAEKAFGSLKVQVSGLEEGTNRLICELDSLSNLRNQQIEENFKLETELAESKPKAAQWEKNHEQEVAALKSTTESLTSTLILREQTGIPGVESVSDTVDYRILVGKLQEEKIKLEEEVEIFTQVNEKQAAKIEYLEERLDFASLDLDHEPMIFHGLDTVSKEKRKKEKRKKKSRESEVDKEKSLRTFAKAFYTKQQHEKRESGASVALDQQVCALEVAMRKKQPSSIWRFFGMQDENMLEVDELVKIVFESNVSAKEERWDEAVLDV